MSLLLVPTLWISMHSHSVIIVACDPFFPCEGQPGPTESHQSHSSRQPLHQSHRPFYQSKCEHPESLPLSLPEQPLETVMELAKASQDTETQEARDSELPSNLQVTEGTQSALEPH